MQQVKAQVMSSGSLTNIHKQQVCEGGRAGRVETGGTAVSLRGAAAGAAGVTSGHTVGTASLLHYPWADGGLGGLHFHVT